MFGTKVSTELLLLLLLEELEACAKRTASPVREKTEEFLPGATRKS